ncbi:general stress protein [Cytobacillus spongiae]|jgi:hypothetical protein|uniref:general stress protein n=1 Tax=Cytobacillus spongiae TaxID=2901381 RepID=UPI001F3946D2|nr:general stress protein [Cytobacillus spongiae]UII55804.1 general stress protein [Cytobacillus spongiae]
MYKVLVAENGVEATQSIEALQSDGYDKEHVYIFAHDKNRSENLTSATSTGDVGIKEQGFFESIGNLFRTRGDELRSKMRSVGMSQVEAERYEEVLDTGKLVIVGSNQAESIQNDFKMN